MDQPFEGVEIATIPDAAISGNLGKAWGVARLLRRRGVDLAIVENHLPAAAFIALTSGARVILHTHAYVKAPSSALDGAVRGQELRRLSGFAFVSEYALGRFRADFPGLRPPQRAVPNGLDMRAWSAAKPKDRSILCVGRALRGKGHLEAMAAIARALPSRPEWSARFMVSDPVAADREPETVRGASRRGQELSTAGSRVDSNVPYAEVKAAWESAAVGMVLTTGPEPFGRTALEALASGAALITSGRGGLAEICGPCAVTRRPGRRRRSRGGARRNSWMRPNGARSSRARDASASKQLFDIRAVARQMDDFIEACLGEGAEKRSCWRPEVRRSFRNRWRSPAIAARRFDPSGPPRADFLPPKCALDAVAFRRRSG